MLLLKRLTMLAVTVVAALGAAEPALAGLGQPSPWQLGLQQSATPVMDNIIWFHDFLLYIITGIAAFVLALLIVVMLRFNARANPFPSRTTHNTLIEIAWTIIPIMILMFIAVPSFKLLFLQLNVPPADLTEAWDIAGKRNEVADGLQGAAGPSGTKTWTLSSVREFAGWLVALRPA